MTTKNKIQDATNLNPSEMIAAATNVITQFTEVSEEKVTDVAEKSLKVVKEYPLHTAIAAGIVGGAIGYFLRSSNKNS